MTNPNNAVGTNGALGGRTSVNAFNDNLAIYASRGIVSGWTVSPSSNMTVSVGGVSGTRDVAIAADASGNKTTVNNISGQPISVTLTAAPSVNSRIDAIVAYVQNPATVSVTTLDNPSACGIISVSGTVASSPVQPTDSVIRAAITADGAAGATAYYVIISTIKIATGTTTITSSLISAGVNSTFNAGHFADGSVTSAALAANSVTSGKIDWTTLDYKTDSTNTASSSIVDKIVLSGLDISAVYLALGEIWINNTSGSVKDFDAYISGLTTEENLQTLQTWWNVFSFYSVLKPNNAGQIKLRYNSNGIAPNRARLTVTRIG